MTTLSREQLAEDNAGLITLLRQREEESERLKQELLDRPFLDRVRIESGTEAVSALTAACKLRDAQLATTQQHLEVQQTATYQAVEREHEAKRQLAAKEAEIERLKERLENSKLCNINLLTLHSHELDDLRAQLASMTKERGDLVEACTKHFQQACQERDALASMTAQVKELEANTHNATVAYWMNMHTQMQQEAKKRFDDWFTIASERDTIKQQLTASTASRAKLEAVLDRCLEDLRQWKNSYPRVARDIRDEALDNLCTNDIIQLGEQALTTERPHEEK